MENMPIPKARIHTAEDYWNLPEDVRAELIDGALVAQASPSRIHQKISFEIAHVLRTHLEKRQGSCEIYVAPFAVNLNADDSTFVEPDVLVVCDPSKLSDRGCEGAPDLVVEVVSPSSRRMDYIVKAALYESAGVQEYWIVDPSSQQTTVYRYADDGPMLRTFPFSSPIPVGIWDTTCTVTIEGML